MQFEPVAPSRHSKESLPVTEHNLLNRRARIDAIRNCEDAVMLQVEWDWTFAVMRWEVSKDKNEEYDSRTLDFDAPEGLADGIYDFNTYGEKTSSGIVVKNGKFQPFQSAWAIYKHQCTFYDPPNGPSHGKAVRSFAESQSRQQVICW